MSGPQDPGAGSPAEREIKLPVTDDFVLPPLADAEGDIVAEPAETIELDATYFDTFDFRLARAGAALRARDDGWTVKLAASTEGDALVRGEHRIEGDVRAKKPPPAALDLVRALTRGSPITPVATLRTVRHRIALHRRDGTPLGELVDDHIEVRNPDSGAVATTFRELELELDDRATRREWEAIVERLRDAGAGPPDPTPKIVRALGPVATAPADVVVPELPATPTAQQVVHRAIAASVARLLANDPGVRLGEDPEAVHQARVATRRLRSDLRTFRALVDEQWANELRDELRWLADVLGVVRDADVMLERLHAKAAMLRDLERDAAEHLLDDLRDHRARALDQLLAALRSERYDALLDRLVAAAQRPRVLLPVDDQDDLEVLRGLVRRPWQQLVRTVEGLPRDPSDTQLHEVRIRVKRARYAAEAVEPAIGKPARSFARALVAVQDVLGEHQDAVVAAEWLRRAALDAPGDQAFAAGLLAAAEHDAAQRARDAWRATWKRVDRKRVRGWL